MPRFNLHDLFWLVLVVAMGCAWRVDNGRSRKAASEAAHKQQLAETEQQRYRSHFRQLEYDLFRKGFTVRIRQHYQVVVEPIKKSAVHP